VYEAPRDPNWQPIPGGEPTLELHLDLESLDDARGEAERLYAAMREEARLPVTRPRVLGTFKISGREPLSSQFMDEAHDMLDQKRYGWAIVAAQVACEIEVRAAIETTASADSGTLARLAIDFPNNYSLMDSRARDVFEVVLGTAPTQAPCWKAYQLHVRRRNNVVHHGARMSGEDATASIDVMYEMLEFVRHATGRAWSS
jgi:hypothetical protein